MTNKVYVTLKGECLERVEGEEVANSPGPSSEEHFSIIREAISAELAKPPTPRKRPSWDEYFLTIAEAVSTRSHDADTQVGCVIVSPGHRIISTGYNGFAAGMPDDRLPNTRPDKYPFMVHAEANAIATAKQDLEGCTCYCLFTPCNDCAKLLLAAGIRRVVCRTAYWNSDWKKIQSLLQLGGVKVQILREFDTESEIG